VTGNKSMDVLKPLEKRLGMKLQECAAAFGVADARWPTLNKCGQPPYFVQAASIANAIRSMAMGKAQDVSILSR
jgi:hypothetical protein